MTPDNLAYFSVLFGFAFLYWMERGERIDIEKRYWDTWTERNKYFDCAVDWKTKYLRLKAKRKSRGEEPLPSGKLATENPASTHSNAQK